jgi:formylglycine-generating enzyme required for sulfatase activity
MGSATEDEDAQPVHRVRLAAFQMSRTEVTREQYARFLKDTGRPEPPHWNHELFNRPGSPVVDVTWDDAAAYCKWAGGRLPTEAEWEYAARGTDGRRYPWGSEEPDRTRAVFHLDIGFGGTQPVGSAKAGASPFGIEDLAGSVYEWCADWYEAGYYAGGPSQDPPGPPAGELRVIRGGSWISLPDAIRSAARANYAPGSRSLLIGIRVIR